MDKLAIRCTVLKHLNTGIKEETEYLKMLLKENPDDLQVSDLCTALGILVALKNEVEELINKL